MVTERFLRALAESSAGAHGPLPTEDAGALAVKLAVEGARGEPIAVATGDELVDELGLPARLASAGAVVYRPRDAAWATRLPRAAVGVTGACLGVAETGTVALAAAADSPRAVSLLPALHLCLLRERDLADTFAEAIGRVAAAPLPSALTWIGGPSRTGDLEMIITLGVHGPAALEVVVVGE